MFLCPALFVSITLQILYQAEDKIALLMSFTYDNKYKPNKVVTKIEKQKLQAKKQVNAHQKAPLDYISPWQSHHQQLYLMQAQNNENLQLKISDPKHNVVNAFLQKIKKSSKSYKKNKNIISRNLTVGQQILNGNSRLADQKYQPTVKKKVIESPIKNYTQSTIYLNQQAQSQMKKHLDLKGVKDVGFGLLEYSKVSSRLKGSEKKEENTMKKSSTSYQGKNSFTFNAYFTHYKQRSKVDDLKMNGNNIVEVSKINLGTKNVNIHRLFADESAKKPSQVVFIKKRKCSNKAAVIDINSTAQEFYEDKIRTAQQQMIQKYHKLAPKKQFLQTMNRCKLRYRTEQSSNGHRYLMRKTSLGDCYKKKAQHNNCRDNSEVLFDEELLRKKYSFLEELKDETLAVRIQNMMRQHPSLAQSLLTTK